MKIRNGFVSNSSSSSFVIAKEALTPLQILAIKEHVYLADKMGMNPEDGPWSITEDDFTISGSTGMDNFDIFEYMDKIGIPREHITGDSW